MPRTYLRTNPVRPVYFQELMDMVVQWDEGVVYHV